jgi:hypothetical protein
MKDIKNKIIAAIVSTYFKVNPHKQMAVPRDIIKWFLVHLTIFCASVLITYTFLEWSKLNVMEKVLLCLACLCIVVAGYRLVGLMYWEIRHRKQREEIKERLKSRSN